MVDGPIRPLRRQAVFPARGRVYAGFTAHQAPGCSTTGIVVIVRILLVEDDRRLAEHTAEYLRGHDAQVEIVEDGDNGLARACSGQHDIVLLDLMLPAKDGLTLCKQLRAASNVPIIMLTARGDEVDRVVGLELGADDYLAKPFSPRELLARIRAVLRRPPGGRVESKGERIQVADLVVDRDRRIAEYRGRGLELTGFQLDLLWVLARSAGRVLSREQIYNEVRRLRGDPPAGFDPSVDRSVDVHLSKIRAALGAGDPGATTLIRTVRGVGYVLGAETS